MLKHKEINKQDEMRSLNRRLNDLILKSLLFKQIMYANNIDLRKHTNNKLTYYMHTFLFTSGITCNFGVTFLLKYAGFIQ